MPMLRSHRQEKFCRELVKTDNASEAYRRAYGVKATVSRPCAYKLRRQPHIKKRILELRMHIKRRSDITYEKILNDYQTALDMAKADGKPDAIISAAREQAKLVGLLVERAELGRAGEFEKMDSIADIISKVREEAGDQTAEALLKAFNLLPAPEEPEDDTQALIKAEPGSDAVN